MTAIVSIAPNQTGTAYTAHVMHSTPDQMKAHEEMGFNEGWGATLTQLEELLKQKK